MGHVQRAPHGVWLEPGSARLLRWLEQYPLQRAQDLVVALAPWERRTVVYERLAELEKHHLIEALHAGIAQGKKLYHLSPLGTYVCDQLAEQQGEERRARWERALRSATEPPPEESPRGAQRAPAARFSRRRPGCANIP